MNKKALYCGFCLVRLGLLKRIKQILKRKPETAFCSERCLLKLYRLKYKTEKVEGPDPSLPGERWREVNIEKYRRHYEVSDQGRVRRHINPQTEIGLSRRGRIMRPKDRRPDSYVMVSFWENGNRINYSIHRLVAGAFLHNPQNKREVNHLNGVKWDNRMCNLQWCTSSENIRHALDTGLFKERGSKKCRRKKI